MQLKLSAFISAILALHMVRTAEAEELKHASLKKPKGKWIDRFGQNSTAQWPQKVHSIKDLLEQDKTERQALQRTSTPKSAEKRDQFESWQNGPSLKASGFFRLEKLNNRHWLVSPSGHLFYSSGIDCVDPGHFTKITADNKDAFTWLPNQAESATKNSSPANHQIYVRARPCLARQSNPFEQACESNKVSFYRINLIRKWGQNWRAEFNKRALARCKSWGFTSYGNWTDDDLMQKAYPYVHMGPPTWELKVDYVEGDIADVFHPDFEAEAFRAAQKIAKYKNDPYLIGYFVDNELPWWNLPYSVLTLKESHCRKHWIEQLKKKYSDIDSLNKSWKTSAKDFDSLQWPGEKLSSEAEKDLIAFRTEFAERFYDVWYRAIKNSDPKHLVLGSRIPYAMDEVVLASARHTDVLSLNHYAYGLSADFDRYYRLTQKPILIGEYDFDSLDAGLLSAYVPVKNQNERGAGFRHYTEQAAARPYIVGTHYFQYIDEPLTGREDGENSFNGFVSVVDVPYPQLVKAAQFTNGRIYSIHRGSSAPSNTQARH